MIEGCACGYYQLPHFEANFFGLLLSLRKRVVPSASQKHFLGELLDGHASLSCHLVFCARHAIARYTSAANLLSWGTEDHCKALLEPEPLSIGRIIGDYVHQHPMTRRSNKNQILGQAISCQSYDWLRSGCLHYTLYEVTFSLFPRPFRF